MKASYHTAILPEHRGNPLIEALPHKLPDSQIATNTSNYPEANDDIRSLPSELRAEYLVRITELVQPLPQYLEAYKLIQRAIKSGYATKNPFSPTTQFYLHHDTDIPHDLLPSTGQFIPKGTAITILGVSGVGKTSMLDKVLHCFPQVVAHEKYNDYRLKLKQVNWLYVSCPHNAHVRGLCEDILYNLAEVLDDKTIKPKKIIAPLISQVIQRLKSSFVGILVIDEMQNLNIGSTKREKEFINFLVKLLDGCGIPIVFCGNPELLRPVKKTIRNARRAETGGTIVFDRLPKDDCWNLVIEELWQLQYTNVITPLTEELNNKLHDLSCGILDIAARTFKEAQDIVIGSDDEALTTTVLEMGYQKACYITNDALSLLRRTARDNETLGRELPKDLSLTESEGFTEKTLHTPNKKPMTIKGDLTRCQHPEFQDAISRLLNAIDLTDFINDPDVFQQLNGSNNQLQILKRRGVLIDDPLNQLQVMN